MYIKEGNLNKESQFQKIFTVGHIFCVWFQLVLLLKDTARSVWAKNLFKSFWDVLQKIWVWF